MQINWQKKYELIKDFLFKLINKEFLIFLIFLAVSTAFWFLSTLNDIYEREIPVALQLTDVPDNVIITEELPDTVRFVVRDKGFNFLQIMMNGEMKPIQVSFKQYVNNKGRGIVNPGDVQKTFRARLSETASITAIKSEHWDFFFNHGTKKKVPIILDSSISTKSNYYVTHLSLTPDSIMVYASEKALDTIKAIYTEHIQMDNISESQTVEVALIHTRGAKLSAKTARLSIITDQLTELTLNVPIKTINVPENYSLKTFPARVDIRVAVGIKRSTSIKPELFSVVADFNDIPASSSEKMPLKIETQPKGIVKASLTQPTVDYLIEN